jgi:carotenoid cleavage dioxygenase
MQRDPATAADFRLALFALALNVAFASCLWFNRSYCLHIVEKVVDFLQGQAARRRRNRYLLGNFAPVSEADASDLKVIGSLPKAVNGVYARTGPNPVLPVSGDYHWCDPLWQLLGQAYFVGVSAYALSPKS